MGVRTGFARAAGFALALAMAAPASAQFSDGYSFLKALRDGESAKALEFINKPGAPVLNARDGNTGEGALHILIKRHDQDWFRFLLGKGAQTELRDREGTTPLLLATRLDDLESIRVLLQVGAMVDGANSAGETPLIVAVHQRSLPAIRLLLASGANPSLTDRIAGKSAMDYAREDPRGGPTLVKLLETAKPAAKKSIAGPTR
jgi:uncharacterized protein